ncbi:MAG: hypothetical protein R3A52_15945 [Polyangiales bacterium]
MHTYLVHQHFTTVAPSAPASTRSARDEELLPLDLLQGLFARIATAVAAGAPQLRRADHPRLPRPGCVLLRNDGGFEVRVADSA